MRSKSSNQAMEIVAIILILLLSNVRAMRILPLYPATATLGGHAWLEVLVWLLTAGLGLWLLVQRGLFNEYSTSWRKNWPMIPFLGIAFFSLGWSVSPSATLYRALVLLFSSLLGAYIGIRYSCLELLDILFWFGALVVIFSFALGLIFPGFGIMESYPYVGSWNGVFFHRNFTGSILALLTSVFLIRILLELPRRDGMAILDSVFYLLSMLLVFLSHSATGYILAILLNLLILLIWTWLKVQDRLRPFHYLLIAGAFVLVGILISLKFNSVLGLFNRDSSLTGRVPLWTYLLTHVVNQRPWFGYGFGAFWTLNSYRLQLHAVMGWPYPVIIGDNGFMDILLYIGIVGLTIFLANVILMIVRSIRFAFHRRTLECFFPLVILFYAVVANITYSLFFELETFVWILMVASLFLATRPDS